MAVVFSVSSASAQEASVLSSDEPSLTVAGTIVDEVTVQTPEYPSRIVTVAGDDGENYMVATVGGLDPNGNYMIASHAAELPLDHKVSLQLLPAPENRVADLRAAGYDGPEDVIIYQTDGGIEGEAILFKNEGTTEDGVSVGTAGLRKSYSTYEIHWPEFPVEFHLNPVDGPVSTTSQISAMKGALSMWSNVSCSDFVGRYAGISNKPGNRTQDNGINLVYWDAQYFKDTGHPTRLGEAWRRFNPATWELVDVEVVLNGGQKITYPAGSTTYDLQSLMARELGHAIGFKHVSDPTNVMNTYLTNNKNMRSLGALDLKAVRYIYQAPACGGVPAGSTDPGGATGGGGSGGGGGTAPVTIKRLTCFGNISPLDPNETDNGEDPAGSGEDPVEDPTADPTEDPTDPAPDPTPDAEEAPTEVKSDTDPTNEVGTQAGTDLVSSDYITTDPEESSADEGLQLWTSGPDTTPADEPELSGDVEPALSSTDRTSLLPLFVETDSRITRQIRRWTSEQLRPILLQKYEYRSSIGSD